MSLNANVQVTLGSFDLAVELEVHDGEVVAVLGPNGSGKTTLIRTLAGLQTLSAGRVVLGDVVLDDPADKTFVSAEERRCGVVFQDYALFAHLSARDNVAFGLRSRGVAASDANQQALEWLERMDLADKSSRQPRELSGGQAQRVALARALATRPRLLLLDEPFAALDASARAAIRQQLRHHLAAFEGPCVIVTHDSLDAAAVADRLVVVEAGRVVQRGTLRELGAAPRTPYVAELTGINLLRGTANGTHLVLSNGTTLQITSSVSGDVVAVIAPRDVALYDQAPNGSPRNTWLTTIEEVHQFGDRARTLLGEPVRIAAEVTMVALDELGLRKDSSVWASVKATQIKVYADDSGS